MPFFSLPRLARCGVATLALLRLSGAAAAPPLEPAATTATHPTATTATAQAPSHPQPANGPAFRLTYHSAFTGYTRHGDTAVGPWREVNDTVQRVGGWRAYAREAAAPAAAASGSAGGLK